MKIYKQYMYSYPHKKDYYNIDSDLIKKAFSTVKEANLYVHIPFCSSKCGYCNLFSAVGVDYWIDNYINSMIRHYKFLKNISDFKINDFVIGGGTPIIMSIKQMEKFFNSINIDIKNHFSVIELSPNETNDEKLKYIYYRGFKRVSIGIQSFNDIDLKFLNRRHSVKNCLKALDLISKYDFENFNIDIIYGIEGQTIESLKYSIDMALSFNPTELFIYPLYIREYTYIFNKLNFDENKVYNFYEFLKYYIESRGYFQISMRRFVRKDILNLEFNNSCGFETNISLGCGGRNYINNLHFCEKYSVKQSDIRNIINSFMSKNNFFDGMKGYILSEREQKNRFIIKNLLFYKGINIEEYYNFFNSNILDDYMTFKNNKFSKYIKYKNNKIILKNLGCSDFIINDILNYEENFNE